MHKSVNWRGLLSLALAVAACTACAPIKLLDSVVPHDSYEVEQGVAYGNDPRQQLDVYRPLPQTAPPAGARPLVVFFYGGTWSHGDRGDFRFVAEALAARGAVVVLPDYRLAPAVRYPVFVEDSAQATQWALEHAAQLGADPKRVFVMGHSSGAYDAAMVALDPRWLRRFGANPRQLAGWIGLAGPYDFLPIHDPEAQAAFDWPDTSLDSQPIAHVSAASPPALLLAGKDDTTVNPQRNTAQMADRLRAANVPVQMQLFDDLGHVGLIAEVAAPLRWLGGPVLPPVLRFLGLRASVE